MTAFLLPKPFKKILVVPSIYDEMEVLSNIEDMSKDYDWTIFNGGICYPNDDLDALMYRLERMQKLIDTHKIVYNVGHQDFLLAKNLDILNPIQRVVEQWVFSKPNVIIADFPQRTVIIVDGGIPKNVKKRDDLINNIEVSFTSYIDAKPWHQSYNGRLGYVISNGPATLSPPQFYNYSMQLGNYYGPDAEVYLQEVGELGLKETILL